MATYLLFLITWVRITEIKLGLQGSDNSKHVIRAVSDMVRDDAGINVSDNLLGVHELEVRGLCDQV